MSTTVKKLQTKKKNKKGFTLVALVIVIAVLAIIAAIAIPTVTNVVNNANKSADQSNAQAMDLALKTAVADIQAGNYTPADDVTVKTVLEKYGVAGGVPAIKERGTHSFKYTKDSGIKVDDGDTALSNATKLSDVFTYD